MTKKIILIIGVLVIAGGVIWFVFYNNAGNTGDGGVGGFSLRSFFPFGKSDDFVSTTTNEGNNSESDIPPNAYDFKPAEVPKLRKISSGPVAGMVILNSGTTSTVRFVEKATGNVYEARSDSASTKRLTNTTIPKIVRAFWLPDGKGFLAQTVDEEDLIQTSYVELKENKAQTETLSPYESLISKLPTGIKEISVSPNGKKIIYYTTRGVSDWFTSNPDGTSPKTVYQSNLTEWLPQWYSENQVLLATKASSRTQSYSYSLNTTSNKTVNLLNSIVGASFSASPDGKKIIYSTGGERPVLTYTSLATSSISSLGFSLPEKCSWDPSDKNYIVCGVLKSIPEGEYPDSWYKGLIETNDFIEKINVEDNSVFLLSDPEEEVGEMIDVYQIVVSKDGRFATFINKQNSSLWLLKIKD